MRVSATLSDVAVTTFTADAGRLRALLPPGVDDDLGLVSAVSFVLGGVNLAPGLRCGHVDYRAYVTFGDETCVWFLGAAMDSALAHTLRLVWRMPWHRASVAIEPGYELRVDGDGRGAHVVATPDGPVDDAVSARLVAPVVGLFGDRRRLRRYSVGHGPLTLRRGTVEAARVELFERLGLVAPDQPAHSVLLVDDFAIDISFPPRRVNHFAPAGRGPVY